MPRLSSTAMDKRVIETKSPAKTLWASLMSSCRTDRKDADSRHWSGVHGDIYNWTSPPLISRFISIVFVVGLQLFPSKSERSFRQTIHPLLPYGRSGGERLASMHTTPTWTRRTTSECST